MSDPGSFPGDPAGRQPDPLPYRTQGAFEYPPPGDGTVPPPGYSAPPPAHWPPPPVPPGAFPPPPFDHAYPQHPPQYPPRYASPYPPGYAAPYGGPAPANGLAIGSLVSSLVGIPTYFFCIGFIGSILGIVLGGVALSQIGKSGQRGKGMAVAGIVLGLVGLVGMGLFSLLITSPSLWY